MKTKIKIFAKTHFWLSYLWRQVSKSAERTDVSEAARLWRVARDASELQTEARRSRRHADISQQQG